VSRTEANHLPRVLIVEDTVLIAMLIEELVRECGCEIAGVAYDIESARQAVARRDYDAVLLDIGLDAGKSFDIADVLLERGVPFAFVTAYHDMFEPRHQKVPIVSKPFSTTSLMNTVKSLLQVVEAPQHFRLCSAPTPTSKTG
jgi:DNA-binding response OmpR family regulator